MYSGNHWGGSLEIENTGEPSRDDYLRGHELDETRQSWMLNPGNNESKRKNKYVDLGCVVCSWKAIKWTLGLLFVSFLVIGLPTIIARSSRKHKPQATRVDNYTLALHKALLFFNAQKSGRLPKNNGIPWRGDSGLKDGSDLPDVTGGLVGGYYDSAENTKFHFPMSFAMTMLSWSLLEYEHKYKAIGEYDHTRELIKWGVDYLLLTFNSTETNKIYSQVGGSQNTSGKTPDDYYCWERPEDMDYPRDVQTAVSAPDLGAEMAAALAAASIVFHDNLVYSSKLTKGAIAVFEFARDFNKRTTYGKRNSYIEPFYNSTGFWDEYMWGAAWLYYATGNNTYLSLATNPKLAKNSKASEMIPDLSVLSWDNKLPAAMILLMRLRIFLSPGYPYEEMLQSYQNLTGLTMCSYLERYHVFNWTKGGLIRLNHEHGPLQYVANAAFLASLFVDYMAAVSIPGWYCGDTFIELNDLRAFATSQIDYILGANPLNMSYVIGYGNKYPECVHHRGASIPHNKIKYNCTGGWKWRDTRNPNPNNITGAMVGGPDQFDRFQDIRTKNTYTEPTLAGNAGLVAALVSLASSGGSGIDKNTIFSEVPPLYPESPPPPPPWKP